MWRFRLRKSYCTLPVLDRVLDLLCEVVTGNIRLLLSKCIREGKPYPMTGF